MKKEILFCDLDGTLIDTLSGATFPKGVWDMKLKLDVFDKIKELAPKYIWIVTNQGGLGKFVVEDDFITKCTYICKCLEEYVGNKDYTPIVNFTFCGAMEKSDPMRKPNTGMLDLMCSSYRISQSSEKKATMLMIGDASGKEGQFSDSDKKCAENFHIDYLDVNDFVNTTFNE